MSRFTLFEAGRTSHSRYPETMLVIEYVSSNCFVSAVRRVFSRHLPMSTGATTGIQFNVRTAVDAFDGGNVLWKAGQRVPLYADGGKTVTLGADRNAATGFVTPIVMSLSDHPQ